MLTSGRPFTSAYDTAIYVGDARATIIELERAGCEECDECLTEQSCTGCDDCDPCDLLCTECLETVRFVVPQVDPGATVVRLYNRHGESNALPLEVLAPPTDTGADTGPTDTGSGDSDPTDTQGDTGPDDTGPRDTSPTHTGSPQTDTSDTAR